MRLAWSRLALRDIDRQIAYIEKFNAFAAKRVEASLISAAKKLREAPELGRPGRRPGTLEYVGLAPYVLVYRVTANTVRIIRVWHGAQLKEGR